MIRERLKATKHSVVGAALQKSDSWAQKALDDAMGVPIDLIEPLLAVLGLKVVPSTAFVANRAVFESYKTIAAKALTDPGALTIDAT